MDLDWNRADPIRKPHAIDVLADTDGDESRVVSGGWPRWAWVIVGAVVAFVAAVIVVLVSGGGSESTPQANAKASSSKSSSIAKTSLPTVYNRPLQFSMQSSSGSPSTYLVVLRPASTPGQFVESDSYPTQGSAQLTTESFGANGIEVSAVTNTTRTATQTSQFATPLMLLKTPWRAGTGWNSTATSTSALGVRNTVRAMDRIAGVGHMTVAGQDLEIIKVAIHHIVTQTGPTGTTTQDSTGTVNFSPLLGVFVSGQSQEVTITPGHATTTTNNQFRVQTIGSGSRSAAPPGASTTPLSLTCPPTIQLYASFRVKGTLTPPVAGAPITILYTLPDGSRVTHNAATDSSGNYTDSIGTNQPGTWIIQATSAPNAQAPATQSSACTTSVS